MRQAVGPCMTADWTRFCAFGDFGGFSSGVLVFDSDLAGETVKAGKMPVFQYRLEAYPAVSRSWV